MPVPARSDRSSRRRWGAVTDASVSLGNRLLVVTREQEPLERPWRRHRRTGTNLT